MLKKSVGGLAFLAFVFTFMSPSLIVPKPANADPDLVYYYRTRVTKIGRLGIVCTTVTVDETVAYTTTSHSVDDQRFENGRYLHSHSVDGNSSSNRIPRERTEYVTARCR